MNKIVRWFADNDVKFSFIFFLTGLCISYFNYGLLSEIKMDGQRLFKGLDTSTIRLRYGYDTTIRVSLTYRRCDQLLSGVPNVHSLSAAMSGILSRGKNLKLVFRKSSFPHR